MSFSNITVKQRKIEAKALKTFLAYSFVFSLVLHIGIIASVIVNLLSKTNQVEEKPIEITFIDIPIQEKVKPESKPEKQQEPKLDIKENPVKQELKLNNNESNALTDSNRFNQNEISRINLEKTPIFESKPEQKNKRDLVTSSLPLKQPLPKENSSFKESNKLKPLPSAQPERSQNSNIQSPSNPIPTIQSLSTPIPTQRSNSKVKSKPNKTDNSQSTSKNDTEVTIGYEYILE